LTFRLSYSLLSEENAPWEALIEEWQHSFHALESRETLLPDNGCRMSGYSLEEQLNSFPEQGFQEYLSERRRKK
jgi:hypothetical protein